MESDNCDAQSELGEVVKKVLALGISAQQISKLPSVIDLERRINNHKRGSRKKANRANSFWTPCRILIIAAVTVLIGAIVHYELYTVSEFSKIWLRMKNLDLQSTKCSVEVPGFTTDVFRPPVNCDVCREVKQVIRVSKISPEEFRDKFAYSGKPVVITDAMSNWTAIQEFDFNFFRSLYFELDEKGESDTLDGARLSCQFFPYKTKFRNLREVFRMSDERAALKDGSEPWYIGWKNCDSGAANIIRRHYQAPYFLPREAENSKNDWFFMGSPGYGAQMHIDHVGDPSWQAQIRGQKRWILKPPPECYFSCQIIEVVVKTGETIVIDTNKWFHQTEIIGEDISITIGSEYD